MIHSYSNCYQCILYIAAASFSNDAAAAFEQPASLSSPGALFYLTTFSHYIAPRYLKILKPFLFTTIIGDVLAAAAAADVHFSTPFEKTTYSSSILVTKDSSVLKTSKQCQTKSIKLDNIL